MSATKEAAALCRECASFHQRKAHELAMLAFKIEDPPEGVRVEVDLNSTAERFVVRFVGPPVDLRKADAA